MSNVISNYKIAETLGSAEHVDKMLDEAVPAMPRFKPHLINVGGVVSAVNGSLSF